MCMWMGMGIYGEIKGCIVNMYMNGYGYGRLLSACVF